MGFAICQGFEALGFGVCRRIFNGWSLGSSLTAQPGQALRDAQSQNLGLGFGFRVWGLRFFGLGGFGFT